MNVFELPACYENNNIVAWRNSFMHRKFHYPYIQYVIKTPTGEFIFETKKNTDLLKFEEPLEALRFETFEALANHVALHGKKGLLYGSYVLPSKEITVILDPVMGESLNFVLLVGGEELTLSAPPQAKIRGFFGLLRFLHRTWKKRGVKNEAGFDTHLG